MFPLLGDLGQREPDQLDGSLIVRKMPLVTHAAFRIDAFSDSIALGV
jgi:hypothetical protein